MTETELENRCAKIAGWLAYVEDIYLDMGSRSAETSSISGFDPDPRSIPCEHSAEWMSGRLCLACDNSGWRVATERERELGLAVDPYSVDINVKGSVRVELAPESRSRKSRRLDAALASLRRDQRVREGADAPETSDSRRLQSAGRKDKTLNKILDAVESMRLHQPALYVRLPGVESLRVLAQLVPGRIDHPPEAR